MRIRIPHSGTRRAPIDAFMHGGTCPEYTRLPQFLDSASMAKCHADGFECATLQPFVGYSACNCTSCLEAGQDHMSLEPRLR